MIHISQAPPNSQTSAQHYDQSVSKSKTNMSILRTDFDTIVHIDMLRNLYVTDKINDSLVHVSRLKIYSNENELWSSVYTGLNWTSCTRAAQQWSANTPPCHHTVPRVTTQRRVSAHSAACHYTAPRVTTHHCVSPTLIVMRCAHQFTKYRLENKWGHKIHPTTSVK